MCDRVLLHVGRQRSMTSRILADICTENPNNGWLTVVAIDNARKVPGERRAGPQCHLAVEVSREAEGYGVYKYMWSLVG